MTNSRVILCLSWSLSQSSSALNKRSLKDKKEKTRRGRVFTTL